MKKISIGMEKENIEKAVQILKQYLADGTVFRMKVQGFHWNIESPSFASDHVFLEEQYEDLQAANDSTAERIRMLGEVVPMTLKASIDLSSLTECDEPKCDAREIFKLTLEDHETLITWLREAIKGCGEADDSGSEDYLIGRLRAHEKFAWMTRSHIVK